MVMTLIISCDIIELTTLATGLNSIFLFQQVSNFLINSEKTSDDSKVSTCCDKPSFVFKKSFRIIKEELSFACVECFKN